VSDRKIDAVVFDLDGVLLHSEELWDEARKRLVAETGGTWRDGATEEMLGMSSLEWSRYVRDRLGVPLDPDEISRRVAAEVGDLYRNELPLIDGATDAVHRLADRWPLGLASSSNREVIDLALELAGVRDRFGAVVSSEEVGRGKPAPDVYLEAARQLGVAPERCAAIEDSPNGIRSAHAAEMRVIAIPNPGFPPGADVLALAAVTLDSLRDLVPEIVEP
jgi:HAD superfamily hydrolase (TIGR01509 family)